MVDRRKKDGENANELSPGPSLTIPVQKMIAQPEPRLSDLFRAGKGRVCGATSVILNERIQGPTKLPEDANPHATINLPRRHPQDATLTFDGS